MSLPARGVWIEIYAIDFVHEITVCRSPQGECGLKFTQLQTQIREKGRSPQGECGLKYEHHELRRHRHVAPRKGSVD